MSFSRMRKKILKNVRSSSCAGATLPEYSLLLSVVLSITFGSLTDLGLQTSKHLESTRDRISKESEQRNTSLVGSGATRGGGTEEGEDHLEEETDRQTSAFPQGGDFF